MRTCIDIYSYIWMMIHQGHQSRVMVLEGVGLVSRNRGVLKKSPLIKIVNNLLGGHRVPAVPPADLSNKHRLCTGQQTVHQYLTDRRFATLS